MKNTIIVTLLIVLILIGGYWVFKPVVPSDSELNLIHQRDSLMMQFKSIQASYDLEELKNKRLTAELLKSKAVAKRSEEKLIKSLANEKVYLKRIKEQTLAMSEIQADSVIRYRFRDDPDSISQKTLLEFARLDQCDSVRSRLSNLNQSYSDYIASQDSLIRLQSTQIYLSREQISLLSESSQIDKQLLQSKDKQLKKLNKKWNVSVGVSYLPFNSGENWKNQVQPSLTVGRTLFRF